MKQEYVQTPQELLTQLESTPEGLSSQEAAARLEKYGPNKLKDAEKPSLLQRFIQQLKDPMLIILIIAAAVSAVTNFISHESFAEVFIILIVVLLNAVLGVFQESKAEAAIEALQTMTAATCKVLRDGKQVALHSDQLVPGDVVLLEAGDAVPADGRLLESASLKIEEAALTGESVPVNKIIDALAWPRARRTCLWATGRTCAIWVPPWSTAAARPSSPAPAWTPRWARSPAPWPTPNRSRPRCSGSWNSSAACCPSWCWASACSSLCLT